MGDLDLDRDLALPTDTALAGWNHDVVPNLDVIERLSVLLAERLDPLPHRLDHPVASAIDGVLGPVVDQRNSASGANGFSSRFRTASLSQSTWAASRPLKPSHIVRTIWTYSADTEAPVSPHPLRSASRSMKGANPNPKGEGMEYETLRYERDGHVTVLTYDRPEQRNAVSRQMNAELHDAWQRFRDDDDEFVLVITGAGDAFCAGWDLADAAELAEAGDWDQFRTEPLQLPGRVRLHAPDRRLQAGDRRGQRLGGRGRARERAARRHPDRRRERRLRRARAALEHRRRATG